MPDCEKVDFDVIGAFGKNKIEHALMVENCKFPVQTLSKELLHQYADLLKNEKIEPYYNAKVQILIGQDNLNLIVSRKLIELNKRLAASRSLLGWTVHGTSYRGQEKCYAVSNSSESLSICDAMCMTIVDDSEGARLDSLIKRFFELEAIGVSDNMKTTGKHDRANKILQETSRFRGDSWETGLLWKSDVIPNVDSKKTAMKRMFALEKKLDREPKLAELFYKEMDRIISQGYAVPVDTRAVRPRVWYVPIFGVYNINKPDKIRVVFDCAAKTDGISLNDQLDAGPDLLNSLPGILIRFRQYAIAIKGDISDMFLRVKVVESDRAIRFLYRGKDRNRVPDEYEATCLIFGAVSSPANAMFIKNKNAERYIDTKPEAVQGIIDDTYMDDLISSKNSEKSAIEFVKDVIKINAEAGFQMHGWASNSAKVMKDAVGENNQSKGREKLLNSSESDRVLGIYWDTQSDELRFNAKLAKIPKQILSGERVPTKREVLSVVMSIYDPLGLIIPFALKSKSLMQAIHRSGINWDDKLRDEEYASWLAWLSEIDVVKRVRIPRCYTPSGTDRNAELHIFCDASLKAYAAAAYLRFENPDGSAHVALVMAKSRSASLKPETVPRLELQAALLGARLATFLKKELRITIKRCVLWTDSSTVIQWIRSEPREHNVFVANRLGEIAQLTQSSEWKWVPSAQNPADDATRLGNNALEAHSRWFGPDFLRRDESHWPVERFLTREEKSAIQRLEPRKTCFAFSITTKLTDELPFVLRLAGWPGLLVHVRRIRKIFSIWREKAHANSRIYRIRRAYDRWKNANDSKPLIQRIRENENYLYRTIQSECFGAELRALKNEGQVKRQSRIAMLLPHIDDDRILKAYGRIATLSGDCNNTPIILDGKHPAVKALVAHYHRKFYHGSNNTLVNELRQLYYVTGLRALLRSLASRCIVCRLRRGKPCTPLMAGRLAARSRPFTHCGVDYFGPMHVKIGRRHEKRWGVLFTCLTTRAIHLEIAYTLNTSSAIMALQRLANRRGSPFVIYSDNGTNFRGACKELHDAIAQLDRGQLINSANNRKIEWRFNPPDAPHMGGAWERLIRSVKTALHAILQEQAPTEEVLYTVLTEIEHSVNSRPLTHVSLDPRDEEALTPNHFLIGSSSGNIELGKYDIKNISLRHQWKVAQYYADAFWKRWLREYLPSLLPRKKWTENEEPLKIGDVVLIIDLGTDRNHWKRGTVTQVFPGKDKQVRVAEIRTSTGTFTRPTHKLIKLLSINES